MAAAATVVECMCLYQDGLVALRAEFEENSNCILAASIFSYFPLWANVCHMSWLCDFPPKVPCLSVAVPLRRRTCVELVLRGSPSPRLNNTRERKSLNIPPPHRIHEHCLIKIHTTKHSDVAITIPQQNDNH